jgi:hypothetical protein
MQIYLKFLNSILAQNPNSLFWQSVFTCVHLVCVCVCVFVSLSVCVCRGVLGDVNYRMRQVKIQALGWSSQPVPYKVVSRFQGSATPYHELLNLPSFLQSGFYMTSKPFPVLMA